MEAREVADSPKVTVTFEVDGGTELSISVPLTIQISDIKKDLAGKLKWSSDGLILIDSTGNTLEAGTLGELNGAGDMRISVFFRQAFTDLTFIDGVKTLTQFKVDINWQAGNTLKRMQIAKIPDVSEESDLANTIKKLEKKESLYDYIISTPTAALYLLRKAIKFTIVDSDGTQKSMHCDRLWTEPVFRSYLTKLKAIREPFSIKFSDEELEPNQIFTDYEPDSTFIIWRKNHGGHLLNQVIS